MNNFNFTETITRVMDFASTENWMDCGDYLIFGWDEYIKESGQEGLDPLKQEGLNSRSLGRALFRIKQAWVSHEVKMSSPHSTISSDSTPNPKGIA